MSTAKASINRYLIKHRVKLMMVSLVLVIVTMTGLPSVKFNADNKSFFSPDNEQLRDFELLENTFGKTSKILLILETSGRDFFSNIGLGVIEDVTERAWRTPHSIRVDSLTNYIQTYSMEDDLVVEPLVEHALDLTEAEIYRIRQFSYSEPSIVPLYISHSGRHAVISITLQTPDNELAPEQESVAFARTLAADIGETYPQITVYLAGVPVSNIGLSEVAIEEYTTRWPLMFVLMFVIMALFFGSSLSVLCVFVLTFLSAIAAMGVVGYLGIIVTPLSASAGTMIFVIGVANSVHLLIHYLRGVQSGVEKKKAMRDSLDTNHRPIALTALTTIIGFLSMNLSKVPPIADLGNIVSLGVFFAYLLTVGLLPCLVMIVPLKRRPRSSVFDRVLPAIADKVVERGSTILFSALLLLIFIATGLPKNEFNDHFTKLVDESNEMSIANQIFDSNLAGLYTIEYEIRSGEPGGVSDPEYLMHLNKFAEWLRSQPEVRSASAYSDVIKKLNMNMNGDDPEHYRVPTSRELAAQYLLIYELSLPFGLDINNLLSLDKSSSRVVAFMNGMESKRMIALQERINTWQINNLPEHMVHGGSSLTLMFTHVGKTVIQGNLQSATFALVLIAIVLLLTFRSLFIGTVSLIPNLFPAAVGLSFWGILYGEIGMTLAACFGITMGIVVDDTVHLLCEYTRCRREKNMDCHQAIRHTFSTVGPALIITTTVLTIGFGSLAFSDFAPNRDLGILTSAIILIALILDFVLLPAILMKAERLSDLLRGRRSKYDSTSPRVAENVA